MKFSSTNSFNKHSPSLFETQKLETPNTPVRVAVPRISSPPNPRSARRSSLNSFSPSASPGSSSFYIAAGTPDRFIPSQRSSQNLSLVRASLFHQNDNSVPNTSSKSLQQLQDKQEYEYRRQLSQVLWGSPELPARIMSFDAKPKQRARWNVENPYSHDVLRATSSSLSSTPPPSPIERKAKKNTDTGIERIFTLEAPDVVPGDVLHLISYGPVLAVALADQLCMWKNDELEPFTYTQDGKCISCVQWSPNSTTNNRKGTFFALGQEQSVEVWSMEKEGVIFEFKDHVGYVTSICWKENGSELVAASKAGIKRYILETNGGVPDEIEIIDYKHKHDHHEENITCLQWHDNTIVSAGNGVIRVWDTNQRGPSIQPMRTMEHPSVSSIKFCPGRPNILVSGGEGGLKFWNVQNGSIRASVKVEAAVTDIVWSVQSEILVAHGDRLSVWKLDSKPTKTAEVTTPGGKILSMDQGPCGQIACIQENEIVTGYTVTGSSRLAHKCRGSMRKPSSCPLFQVPMLR